MDYNEATVYQNKEKGMTIMEGRNEFLKFSEIISKDLDLDRIGDCANMACNIPNIEESIDREPEL